MKKSLIINLYGGPGSGKSTCAAYIFSQLKMHNINAELITEQTKAEIQNMESVFYGKVASLEPYKFYLYTNNDKIIFYMMFIKQK